MRNFKNHVQLIGNIGSTPELKTFENGKTMVKFAIATNDVYVSNGERKETTEWHNIIAWGKVAENLSKYVIKGQKIGIQGKLTHRTYEKDGEKRFITEVVADSFLMMGKKENSTASSN